MPGAIGRKGACKMGIGIMGGYRPYRAYRTYELAAFFGGEARNPQDWAICDKLGENRQDQVDAPRICSNRQSLRSFTAGTTNLPVGLCIAKSKSFRVLRTFFSSAPLRLCVGIPLVAAPPRYDSSAAISDQQSAIPPLIHRLSQRVIAQDQRRHRLHHRDRAR